MAEMEDFLDACGIDRQSQNWHAAFSGVPIAVDGSEIQFLRVSQSTHPPE
jgi:hypothetical protein